MTVDDTTQETRPRISSGLHYIKIGESEHTREFEEIFEATTPEPTPAWVTHMYVTNEYD